MTVQSASLPHPETTTPSPIPWWLILGILAAIMAAIIGALSLYAILVQVALLEGLTIPFAGMLAGTFSGFAIFCFQRHLQPHHRALSDLADPLEKQSEQANQTGWGAYICSLVVQLVLGIVATLLFQGVVMLVANRLLNVLEILNWSAFAASDVIFYLYCPPTQTSSQPTHPAPPYNWHLAPTGKSIGLLFLGLACIALAVLFTIFPPAIPELLSDLGPVILSIAAACCVGYGMAYWQEGRTGSPQNPSAWRWSGQQLNEFGNVANVLYWVLFAIWVACTLASLLLPPSAALAIGILGSIATGSQGFANFFWIAGFILNKIGDKQLAAAEGTEPPPSPDDVDKIDNVLRLSRTPTRTPTPEKKSDTERSFEEETAASSAIPSSTSTPFTISRRSSTTNKLTK